MVEISKTDHHKHARATGFLLFCPNHPELSWRLYAIGYDISVSLWRILRMTRPPRITLAKYIFFKLNIAVSLKGFDSFTGLLRRAQKAFSGKFIILKLIRSTYCHWVEWWPCLPRAGTFATSPLSLLAVRIRAPSVFVPWTINTI